MQRQVFAREAGRLASGVPEHLAQRAAIWPLLHTAFDMIEIAQRTGADPFEVARQYWRVFDVLDLGWLWEAVGTLPRSDRWQTQARSAVRDDLFAVLAELTAEALVLGSVEQWRSTNERAIARTTAMFSEIRRADRFDITTLTVALRQLRNLTLSSERTT